MGMTSRSRCVLCAVSKFCKRASAVRCHLNWWADLGTAGPVTVSQAASLFSSWCCSTSNNSSQAAGSPSSRSCCESIARSHRSTSAQQGHDDSRHRNLSGWCDC